MSLDFIKSLIDRGIISASTARSVEIAVYTCFLTLLTYVWGALQTNNRGEWRVALWTLLTWICTAVLAGITKELRDRIKDKEKMLTDLGIEKKYEWTI